MKTPDSTTTAVGGDGAGVFVGELQHAARNNGSHLIDAST
jgi:hypothetical protein